MLHRDTGFPLSPSRAEARSPEVERCIAGLKPGRTAISHWTRVEFSSLPARNVRVGVVTALQADQAGLAFEIFVSKGCTLLDVEPRDFDLERRFLADHRSGLRAGDALHLAVAPDNAAAAVYSLDNIMAAVGLSLGLPMNPGFPAAS